MGLSTDQKNWEVIPRNMNLLGKNQKNLGSWEFSWKPPIAKYWSTMPEDDPQGWACTRDAGLVLTERNIQEDLLVT
jgi:hypothetical protein